MLDFVILSCHVWMVILHFRLGMMFLPIRDKNLAYQQLGTVFMFASGFLHLFYAISIVFYWLDMPIYNLLFSLAAAWLVAFFPPMVVPVLISTLTTPPENKTVITHFLHWLSGHKDQLTLALIPISVLIILFSIPSVFPLTEWNPQQTYGVLLKYTLGLISIWILMLLSGMSIDPSSVFRGVEKQITIFLLFILFLFSIYALSTFFTYPEIDPNKPLIHHKLMNENRSWAFMPILSTLGAAVLTCWIAFRFEYLDIVVNRIVRFCSALLSVVGFYFLLPFIENLSSNVYLSAVMLYLLFVAALYHWIMEWVARFWCPPTTELASIHEKLPEILATCYEKDQAIQATEKFISDLFRASVAINKALPADIYDSGRSGTICIESSPVVYLSLGYIRGWMPWLSEAQHWARSVALYLQTHLRLIESMDTIRKKENKAETMAKLASRAELDSLRAQIRPHFLFNTLNTIHSYIEEDPRQAERTIELLADLMRESLVSSGQDLVPVSQEISFSKTYLEIEKVRHGDRLNFNISIEKGCEHLLVPHFCIQPLVENAIKHGLDVQMKAITIDIAIERNDNTLTLSICDSGPGLDANKKNTAKGFGIALSNIRERLARQYGPEASLIIGTASIGGVASVITIPTSEVSK